MSIVNKVGWHQKSINRSSQEKICTILQTLLLIVVWRKPYYLLTECENILIVKRCFIFNITQNMFQNIRFIYLRKNLIYSFYVENNGANLLLNAPVCSSLYKDIKFCLTFLIPYSWHFQSPICLENCSLFPTLKPNSSARNFWAICLTEL